MKNTTLTEKEVRNIVQNEMAQCFKNIQLEVSGISSDMKEIKTALLGDDNYLRKGLIAQVNENTEYINRIKTLKVADNAMEVIEWYKDWNTPSNGFKNSRFEYLADIMSTFSGKLKIAGEIMNVYSNAKWIVTAIVSLEIVNVIRFIMTLIEFFQNK